MNMEYKLATFCFQRSLVGRLIGELTCVRYNIYIFLNKQHVKQISR